MARGNPLLVGGLDDDTNAPARRGYHRRMARVRLAIERHAQEAELRADAAAQLLAVLADARGEGQHVEAAEDGVAVEVRKIGQERAMVLVDRLGQRRKGDEDALAELNHIYAILTTRILNGDDAARAD